MLKIKKKQQANQDQARQDEVVHSQEGGPWSWHFVIYFLLF